MMTDHVTRWILSAVFAGVTGYHLCRGAGAWRPLPGWRSTLGDAFHALMGIAMVVMLWISVVPDILYVTVFTTAMLWFVAEALFVTRPAGVPVVIGRALWHPHNAWYHAMMMGSMVWMAVVMSTMSSSMTSFPDPVKASSDDMASMAGMAMSMPAAAVSPGGTDAMSALPMWAKAPCVALAIVFCAAAIRLIACGLRPVIFRRTVSGRSVAAEVIGGVMAAAMAVTFAGMA